MEMLKIVNHLPDFFHIDLYLCLKQRILGHIVILYIGEFCSDGHHELFYFIKCFLGKEYIGFNLCFHLLYQVIES